MNITATQLFKFVEDLEQHELTCGCVLERVTPSNQNYWGLPLGTPVRWTLCPERNRLSMILYLAGLIHAGTDAPYVRHQLKQLLTPKEVSSHEL